MGDIIRITHNQGSILLQGAVGGRMSADVGGRKFNDQAQAKINEKFRLLGKALKKLSTRKEGRYLFGEFAYWKPVELSTKTLNGSASAEMVEAQRETIYNLLPDKQDEEIEVELTGAMRSGIYWLCYLWTSPGSAACQNAGFHDEISWPLIEAIGKEDDFRKDLGLKVDGDDEDGIGGDDAGGKVHEMPKKEPAEAKA